jgi:hypothetical protein
VLRTDERVTSHKAAHNQYKKGSSSISTLSRSDQEENQPDPFFSFFSNRARYIGPAAVADTNGNVAA